MSFRKQGAAIGGIGVIIAVAMGAQSADLKMNYTPVQAIVTAAHTDCFVEDGDSRLTESESDDLAYMDCAVAPKIAAGFDFGAGAVKRRVEVSYAYVSPVDGHRYEGSLVRTGHGESHDFTSGAGIPVFAHTSNASRSRTSSANPFVNDAHEI